VLLYQIVQGRDETAAAPIYVGLILYAVFVIGFRYFNIYRTESRWKLAIETWVMIVFITWVLEHTGRLDSPLLNLYLLTIITMAHLAPMLLVAYITTMLSADIRSALSRIKVISETDELTGIYNVRAFTALADRTHKQSMRYGHTYSVLMIDSDNLKTVNDSYGHESGNRLLKLVVTCIQQRLRETDVFARYGGDEFVLLLPQTRADGAFEVAERIRKTIADTPLDTHGKRVSTTVSVGIAAFPEHGDELAVVMNRADQALYISKKRGRNCVSVSGDQH